MDLPKTINSSDKVDIETHFKLYAGPGAGKTTFLVNHIKNVLTNSRRLGKNKKIACITYTNIGVETILKKIDKSVDKVEVSTIHSFLYKHIVKPYIWIMKENYNIPIDKIRGHDEIVVRYSILKKWIKETEQGFLYQDDEKKVRKELESLEWVLNDEIHLEKNINKRIGSKIKNDHKKLMKYKLLCWEEALVSHDDVLFFTYELLNKEPRILDIMRAKFPYIFLDEFQDTSPIQTEIIKKIGEKETIIGVIGDEAQSIYSFQGASLQSFIDFKLNKLKLYKIENNYRSTEQIINVLNNIRKDNIIKDNFNQKSPINKTGRIPHIIFGNRLDSYNKVKKLLTSQCVYTLSRKNETSNFMKINSDGKFVNIDIDEFMKKESNIRPWLIRFTITSIEHARQNNVKDAIHYMNKAYRKIEVFNENEDTVKNIFRLLNAYDDFKDTSLKEFYNNYLYGFFEVKKKITKGEISKHYESIRYNDISILISINDDNSLHRTIHKSKGDEFDNVLLILSNEDDLKFMLDSDIFNDEEHRIYYVAVSRAKENLFINVPKLSKNIIKLKKLGFGIIGSSD